MRKQGHLENDVLKLLREAKANQEFFARRRVAVKFGLLPAQIMHQVNPLRSARRKNIGDPNRGSMILYAIGLGITLFMLLFWNYDMIPETIVVNRQNTEVTIINNTIIGETIIRTEPVIIEKEVIIKEEVPDLAYRGNLWCNGKAKCYQIQ